jgi:hypothetical protein
LTSLGRLGGVCISASIACRCRTICMKPRTASVSSHWNVSVVKIAEICGSAPTHSQTTSWLRRGRRSRHDVSHTGSDRGCGCECGLNVDHQDSIDLGAANSTSSAAS